MYERNYKVSGQKLGPRDFMDLCVDGSNQRQRRRNQAIMNELPDYRAVTHIIRLIPARTKKRLVENDIHIPGVRRLLERLDRMYGKIDRSPR